MAMQNAAPVIGLLSMPARPHPGRRLLARGLWRGVQAQRAASAWCADQRDHGAVRGGDVYSPGDDRLIFHGTRHLLHVITGPEVVKTVTQEDVTPEPTRRREGAHQRNPPSPTAPNDNDVIASRNCGG